MRRGFKFPIRGIFLALLAVTGIFMVSNSAEALPWVSTYQTQLSSNGAGARADRTQVTTLPPPPTGAGYYFNTVFHTTPADPTLPPADRFKLYADADVPNGAWVATNKSFIRIGAFNGPCATTLPVPISGDFQLFDATTDDSVLVSHADGVNDNNGDGLFDGVTAYPVAVDSLYPQGDVGVPRSRAYGRTILLGSPVAVHFLTYEPGTLAAQGIPASLGYVTASFAVTGDPGVPTAGAVSDACTLFLSTNKHFGRSRDNVNTALDESGIQTSRNPTTQGTYNLGNYVLPVRDTDDDGIENSLDSCPYIANTDASPRVDQGPDLDGIDSACDPNSGVNDGIDADGDSFVNRLDNCPLIFNPDQLETESTNAGAFGSDGGSKTDSIGDACDVTPAVPDGHYHTTAAFGPNGTTSGPQCLVDVTCGHICTSYAYGSPPMACTTFNPSGCTGTTGTPCTTPASPPVRFTSVTIGPVHDVKLNSLTGAQTINGAQTVTYTVKVRNVGDAPTEDIQVVLVAQGVHPDCTFNQTQNATALAVPNSGPPTSVVFSVTFPGCANSPQGDLNPAEYAVTADACHANDPVTGGFFAGPNCPGSSDGDTDVNSANDAPIQLLVNDTSH